MPLKTATLLAIIGISCKFALRTAGTFWPDIFKILIAAQAAQILSLLCGLTILIFFISFYRKYVREGQIQLKRATVLAVIGSSAMLLVTMKSLILVINNLILHIYDVSPYLVTLLKSHYIGAIVPWVNSIFILFFFIVFYKETLHKERMKLRKPALFAVMGSSIGTLLLTFVLFNFLYIGEVGWFLDLSKKLAIVFIPVSAFSFLAILYFFSYFYKEQNHETQA